MRNDIIRKPEEPPERNFRLSPRAEEFRRESRLDPRASEFRSSRTDHYGPTGGGYQSKEASRHDFVPVTSDWRRSSEGAIYRSPMDRTYDMDRRRFEKTPNFNHRRDIPPDETYTNPLGLDPAYAPRREENFGTFDRPWGPHQPW